MLIRPMQLGDVETVVNLALANYDGVLAEHHSAEVLAELRVDVTADSLRERMTWKRVFVVEHAGRVVATGSPCGLRLVVSTPKHTVSHFYVDPAFQARGVGRLLLAQLTQVARDAGADTLHVPSSRNAIGFYEHLGFAVDLVQPDTAIEITWMTLPLADTHRTGAST